MSLSLPSGEAHAAAHLSKTSGFVQYKPSGVEKWEAVKTVPHALANGDAVRTGLKALAVVDFDDGSKVELGANASFTLEEASGSASMLNLGFGALKAFVQKLGGRKFQVRTPTAVCSVRGTEFRVEVMSGGRTTVDLYKGLLGVADNKGSQVLMHPNERLEVDLKGVGRPGALPSQTSIQRTNFHALMQKEMSLDLSKEQVMTAALSEMKLSEFQQGKSIIDVFGKRVRIEQYIVRPQPNQFKLVVLNDRASSFNYFYYLGTFNQNLPTDMTVALKQLGGSVGTAPDFWLTGYETGRSNTIDSIVEVAQGGHVVDVNNNGVPADAVSSFFDPATNAFVNTVGKSVFLPIFDRYGFYINGNLKYGWTGANLQSYSLRTDASLNDPITGAALAQALPARSVTTTFPDANNLHQVFTESYSDGTLTTWDNYIITDDGKLATQNDFAGGAPYREKILDFNFQQVISSTEFGGRKIDLVIAPKILVQSGLIQ